MAETNFVTAPVASWQKVSDDLQNVIITSKYTTAVKVYIGSTPPDDNSAFHTMDSRNPFSMAGITAQDVYIRSAADTPVQVTVTAV